MKKKSTILLLFISISIFSQKKFSKEISFITDNDLYTSTKFDRYYTNGMFFSYRYLSKKKNGNLEKKILNWQIGHEMYTPYKAIVKTIHEHDRPFASYLYGSFGINRIYKNNSSFKTTLQVGVIGSNAFGKELQDFIHDIYGFNKAIGWKYQVKNAIGINFNTEYLKQLTKDNTDHFDLSWISEGKLGTIYTNVSTGFYGRIGFKSLQKIANSIAFNTNINNEKTNYVREVESFIYIKPMLRYAFYDATLQGSFQNKNSEVTNELVPLVFDLEVGLKFTVNRFNLGYVFNYNTNKSKNLRYTNGQKYGSIVVNYLLR
ncbi:MAG: lipid A deacylase LpxR family protein [Polaribacter sp.]|uniref:lipid A deacylase LpxR family protein n=1 Tax=Polaribacter sp. TaxID=1920175 RepID=UPI002F353C01